MLSKYQIYFNDRHVVLIISQTIESSTDQVIDWLNYYNIPFKRLNGMDFYKQVTIQLSNKGYDIKISDIDWNKIGVIWFRRWVCISNKDQIYIKSVKENRDRVVAEFNEFIRNELKTLVGFFFDSIPSQKLFGRMKAEELNKLSVLKKALELDIMIPDTYILTTKESYERLPGRSEFITKAISNAPAITNIHDVYKGYTSTVDKLPKELANSFSPSLFQNSIKKKYEIRAFLLDGKFYSMAIFSQNDPQTEMDFRMYNREYPNTTVPFKLPDSLKEKLLRLAHYFNLKTGSFDIIKTIDNQYIFLEINAGGQFGMVSYPCNYNLENKIAKSLINFNSCLLSDHKSVFNEN